MREPPALSERTRRAIQDYTALNTIISAFERMRAGAAQRLDLAILEEFTSDGHECERVRLRLNCPLGRRAMALGMLRTGRSTRAGVVR